MVAKTKKLPEEVVEYIQNLATTVETVGPEVWKDLMYYYDRVFNDLTSKYYSDAESWPSFEVLEENKVLDSVKWFRDDGKAVFEALYNEIRIRHIYAKNISNFTLELAKQSYENYQRLFELLLKSRKRESIIRLPSQWIWNIIDEYIYQFQTLCNYFAFKKGRNAAVNEEVSMWKPVDVMRQLHALVEKSKFRSKFQEQINFFDLSQCIGYFSLIGILRVNVLMGDFYSGLQAISCIDLFGDVVLSTKIASSVVTLFYYASFSYIMLRRYNDAHRCLKSILSYLLRTKQSASKSYQMDNVSRITEQLYSLLAIVFCLVSFHLDESLYNSLRLKHSKNISQMKRGEISVFKELFQHAQPKSLVPFSFPLEKDVVKMHLPQDTMLNLFVQEVTASQHTVLPTIKAYLKLYSSISLEKLGNFIDVNDPEQVHMFLLRLKHKTIQYQYSKNYRADRNPLDQNFQSSMTDVDYHIIDKVIYVADYAHPIHYADTFIKNTKNLNKLL